MEVKEITDQILQAWDEVTDTPPPEHGDDEPETETEQPTPEEEEIGEEEEGADAPPAEEEEAPVEEEGDEEETPAEEPETEGDEETEEEDVVAYKGDDPAVQAFLRKFNGDVGKALRYGLESQQVLSRQGQEKQALEQRVGQLETELQNAKAFSNLNGAFTPEQREWIGTALESGDPVSYIRVAVDQGEYGLARAVCDEWGNEAPYEALRVAQQIDAHQERTMVQQVEAVDVPPAMVLEHLVENIPDIRDYAGDMTAVIEQLGDGHPWVLDARSLDPNRSATGLFNIYEMARASKLALASTREDVKNGHRAEADTKRKKAVVSSASVSPSPSESARPVKLGPGLTLDALEEEWERSK